MESTNIAQVGAKVSNGGSLARGERCGYQIKLAPIATEKSECAIGTCYNWTIGPRFRLVGTFDLAPPSGRVALGGRFPGLKPWAESCSPFGFGA
jgi:hypothetical protein